MRFQLSWHDRRVGSNQTPRRFLDYIVDGESLYDRHGYDYIGCLGWLLPDADDRAAQRLLRKEPPDVDGRVAIYLCPEDADLLCGALTARIERDGDDIVWSEPAMSSFDHVAQTWHHEPLEDWPALRFEVEGYWTAITNRPKLAVGRD